MKHIAPFTLFVLAACGAHKVTHAPPPPPAETPKSYAATYAVTGSSDCGSLNANWLIAQDANGLTVDTAPELAFVSPVAVTLTEKTLTWTEYQVEDYSGCEEDRTLKYSLTGAPGGSLVGTIQLTESAGCPGIHGNNCKYDVTASPAKE